MVAQRFVRPPNVAAALAALPDEGDAAFLDELRAVKLPEVMVIARRGAANAALRRQIERMLEDMTTKRIHAAAVTHGKVPKRLRDDVKAELAAMFWENIQEESYFEVRFNAALKTLAVQAGQRVRGRRKIDRLTTSLDAMDTTVPDPNDAYEAHERRAAVRRAKAALPEDQYRAITLNDMGFPIFSEDPSVFTVANALRCSERKARQVIADARAALETLLREEGFG